MLPIKIAQIGSGHDHAPAALQGLLDSKYFEVVGFAEPSEEFKLRADTEEPYTKVKRYTVEELLNMPELEAVAIETEEELATEYAIMFARSGVAIHLDKPGSQNLESFREFISIMKEKKLPLSMGYMYRFNPAIKEALADIKSGKYGEIYSVEAQMSCFHPKEKREWLKKFKGGMMYFLGCHDIDLVMQIMGEPQEVIPFNTKTGIEGVDSEDLGFAVLKYKNGLSFVKSCASEWNGFERRQLVILGSKGSIEMKPIEKQGSSGTAGQHTVVRKSFSDPSPEFWIDRSKVQNSSEFDRYSEMLASFAKTIRGEIESPNSYDYELKLFETIMKCCGVI